MKKISLYILIFMLNGCVGVKNELLPRYDQDLFIGDLKPHQLLEREESKKPKWNIVIGESGFFLECRIEIR